MTDLAYDYRLTAAEWGDMLRDPVLDRRYLKTQMGPLIADYLIWKADEDGARPHPHGSATLGAERNRTAVRERSVKIPAISPFSPQGTELGKPIREIDAPAPVEIPREEPAPEREPAPEEAPVEVPA